MRSRYIPAAVMLAAGAVTSILNIINKVDKVAGLNRLLIVLVIFYIIGLIARAIIRKAFEKKPQPEDITDNQGENEDNTEKKPEENK